MTPPTLASEHCVSPSAAPSAAGDATGNCDRHADVSIQDVSPAVFGDGDIAAAAKAAAAKAAARAVAHKVPQCAPRAPSPSQQLLPPSAAGKSPTSLTTVVNAAAAAAAVAAAAAANRSQVGSKGKLICRDQPSPPSLISVTPKSTSQHWSPGHPAAAVTAAAAAAAAAAVAAAAAAAAARPTGPTSAAAVTSNAPSRASPCREGATLQQLLPQPREGISKRAEQACAAGGVKAAVAAAAAAAATVAAGSAARQGAFPLPPGSRAGNGGSAECSSGECLGGGGGGGSPFQGSGAYTPRTPAVAAPTGDVDGIKVSKGTPLPLGACRQPPDCGCAGKGDVDLIAAAAAAATAAQRRLPQAAAATAAAAAAMALRRAGWDITEADPIAEPPEGSGICGITTSHAATANVDEENERVTGLKCWPGASVAAAAAAGTDADGAMPAHETGGEVPANLPDLLAEWHLGQRAVQSADVRRHTASLTDATTRKVSGAGAAAASIRAIAQGGTGGTGAAVTATAAPTPARSETLSKVWVAAAAGQAVPAPWPVLGRGPRNRSTRYKGVSLYRRTGRYEAHIWHEGRQLHIGTYSTDVEAALAYDRVSRYLRGPAAVLNFPDEAGADVAATAVEAAAAAGGDAADGSSGGGGGGLAKASTSAATSNAAVSGGAMKAAARHQHGPCNHDPQNVPADVRRSNVSGLKGRPGNVRAAEAMQPVVAAADDDASGDGGRGNPSAMQATVNDAPMNGLSVGMASGKGGGGAGRGTSALVKPWPSSLAVSKSKITGGGGGGGVGGEDIGAAAAVAAAAAVRSVRRRISAAEPSSAPHFQLPRSALIRAASSHDLRTTATAAAAAAAAAATAAAAAAAAIRSPRGSGGGNSGGDGAAAAQRSQPELVDKPLQEHHSQDNAGNVADGRLPEVAMDRVESWMQWQASATGGSSPPALVTCIPGGGGGHGGVVRAASKNDQAGVAAATGNGCRNNLPVPGTQPLQPPPPSTPLNRNCSAGSSSYSCSYEFGHGAHTMQTAATGCTWAGELGRGSGDGSGFAVHGGNSDITPEHVLQFHDGDACAVVGVGGTQPRLLPGGVLDLAPPLWPLQLPLSLEPLSSVPRTQAATPATVAGLSGGDAGRQGDMAVSGSGWGCLQERTRNGSHGVSSYPCRTKGRGLADGAAAPPNADCDAADTTGGEAFIPNPFIELEVGAGMGGNAEPEALLTPVPIPPSPPTILLQQQQQQKQRRNVSRQVARGAGNDCRGGGNHKRAIGSAALQALLSAGVPPQLLRALLAHTAGSGSSYEESCSRDARSGVVADIPPPSTPEHAPAPQSHRNVQVTADLDDSRTAAPASLDVAAGEGRWHQPHQALLPLPARQTQLQKAQLPTSSPHPAAHRPPHNNPHCPYHVSNHLQLQQLQVRQQLLPYTDQAPPPGHASAGVAASPLNPPPAPAPASAAAAAAAPDPAALDPPPRTWKDAAVASILRHLARPPQAPFAVHRPLQPAPTQLQTSKSHAAAVNAAASNSMISHGDCGAFLSPGSVGGRAEQEGYPPTTSSVRQEHSLISASTCRDSTLPPRPGPAVAEECLEGRHVRPPEERPLIAPPFRQTQPAPTDHGFGAALTVVTQPEPADPSAAAKEDEAAERAPQPVAASPGGEEGSSNRLFWVGGQLHGLGGALLDFLHAPPVTASSIRSLLLSQRQQQQNCAAAAVAAVAPAKSGGGGSGSCLDSAGGTSAPRGFTAAAETHVTPAVGGANFTLVADSADDAMAVVRPGAAPAGDCRRSDAASKLWAMGTQPDVWLGAFDFGGNGVSVGTGWSGGTVQRSLTAPSPSSPPMDPCDIGGRGGAVQRSLTVPLPSSPPMAKLQPFPGPYKRPREDSSGSSGGGAPDVTAPDVAAPTSHDASAALVAAITDLEVPGSGAVPMCIDDPTDGVRSTTTLVAEQELGRGSGAGGSGNGSEGLPSAATHLDVDGGGCGGRGGGGGGGAGSGWRRGEGSAAAMRTHPDKKTRLLYGVYGIGGGGGGGCGEAPA